MDIQLTPLINAAMFAFLGIALFVVGFVVIDKMSPYELWKEIVEEKNVALAILVGAISMGMCIIIAAAVH
jgi:putative membrane protein